MKRHQVAVAMFVLAFSAIAQLAQAQQPQANDTVTTSVEVADENAAAIKKSANSFVEAFNHGDAKAIAALWTASGEYIDEVGSRYAGQEAIEKRYADFFKVNPGASLALEVDSVRMVSPETAIEDGHAVLTFPSAGESTASAYSVVHVKVDGGWLMASVRDARADGGTAHEHIADLQWLIGTWTAEEPGVTTEFVCSWIGEKSFVERKYTTKTTDGVEASGVQIIGWNAQAGHVQSWSFSADGSFAVGHWTPTEGGWQALIDGVTIDGAATTAINRLHRLDDNAYVWQSVNRSLNGTPIPDSGEVIMRRKLAK